MRMMSNPSPVQVAAQPFETAAATVMADLQAALGALVDSLPDPIRRAVDLERCLKLDKKLAWQIFRLSRTSDLGETANVPSLTAAARVMDAARKRGTPEKTLERVREAFESFENLASLHGGDRAGLMSMLSGMAGEQGEQYELRVRKSLFRGNAHVWGVQERLAAHTAIYMPRTLDGKKSEAKAEYDLAMVVGDIGMSRRRQTDPLALTRWLWTHYEQGADQSGRVLAPGARDTVDPALNILQDFSSRPLPKMINSGTAYGAPQTELVVPPGQAGAVTLYSMQSRKGVPLAAGEPFFFQALFRMPMETCVWELLIPVGWSNPATARAAVYGRRYNPEQAYDERTEDLMSQRETLDYLGVREGVPSLPGSPDHAEAVRHVLEKQGWLGTAFDVYRCRVEYPVLHSMLVVRVEAMKR
jgi:hypothetical protein